MVDSISLTLSYAGQLAGEAARSEERVEVPMGISLQEVLRAAADRHGETFRRLLFTENGDLRRALIVSLDDVQVPDLQACELSQNGELFLMTPIAGG